MRVRTTVVFAAAVAACATGAGEAQEPTPEQIARVMELAVPGPEHEVLAQLVGDWDQVVRGWTEPGAEPFEVAGRAENRAILGGRFIESRLSSTYLGQPVETHTIYGFDRRHGEYTVIGMDTFGTYWVTAQGPRRQDGTIVMSGTDEMVTLNHTQVYDMIVRIEGPDRYVTQVIFHDEMHTRGGPPFKAVEVVSTRRSR